jgi:hypothetical protein
VRVWIATQLVYNWIEFLAVPIATGIMEAQPIALVLLFGALLFTGRSADAPLGMGSIVLLLVGLHWWAMLVRRVLQRGTSEKRAKLLYLAGLPLAAAIMVGTHVLLLHNALALVIVGGLILWCWRRAVYRVQMDVYEEQLKASFITGFLVLLALVVIAAIDTTARYKGLLDSLSYAFPLFFLSGLMALSFLRLSRLKREYRRQVSGRSQADPTRRWPIALTGLWGIIVVVSLTLAALLFPALQMVFSLLWSAVEAFVGWIISLLAPLFSQQPTPLIRGHKPVVLPPKYVVPHPQPNPVAVIVAVIVLVTIVFLLIWLTIREWLPSVNSDEDEVRERLAVRETLRARQQQGRRHAKGALEPLDPTSARAHYRKFLQVMARRGDGLGRQVDETPGEYQARLLTLMARTAQGEGQEENAPADAAILDELTRAYRLERYGGKHMGRRQHTYLSRWIPRLLKRFTGSKATQPSRLRLYLNRVFPISPPAERP